MLNAEPEKSVPFSAKFEKRVYTKPLFARNNVMFFLMKWVLGAKSPKASSKCCNCPNKRKIRYLWPLIEIATDCITGPCYFSVISAVNVKLMTTFSWHRIAVVQTEILRKKIQGDRAVWEKLCWKKQTQTRHSEQKTKRNTCTCLTSHKNMYFYSQHLFETGSCLRHRHRKKLL